MGEVVHLYYYFNPYSLFVESFYAGISTPMVTAGVYLEDAEFIDTVGTQYVKIETPSIFAILILICG